MRTLCNELEDVKHKAYEIAVQLGVSHSKFMQFKQDGNVLASSLNHWLCGNVPDVPVSWRSVVVALESKQVGERGCAKKIQATYCCEQGEIEDDQGQLVSLLLLASGREL